jgi:hypothetical protein
MAFFHDGFKHGVSPQWTIGSLHNVRSACIRTFAASCSNRSSKLGKPLPRDICTVHAVNVLDTYELPHGQCGIPD